MRSDLTWFQYNRVTCCKRASGGGEQQLNRIVPRRDDRNHAEWLSYTVAAAWHRDDRSLDALGLGPLVEVLGKKFDLADGEPDVCDPSFARWLPEVSGKGAEEFGVLVTEAQLKAIADSKRVSGSHKAPPEKHVIIITAPKGWVAPKPAAAPVAPAAPAPVKPAVCPTCGK